MRLDSHQARKQVEDLRREIQGLSYLIKMDNIHPENYENPLIAKRIKLELCLENLLMMVKREKAAERKTNRAD